MTPGRKFLYHDPASGLRAELWRVRMNNPDSDLNPWDGGIIVTLPYPAFKSSITKIKYTVMVDALVEAGSEYKIVDTFQVKYRNVSRNSTAPDTTPDDGITNFPGYIQIHNVVTAPIDVQPTGTTEFGTVPTQARSARWGGAGDVDIRFLVIGS